MPKEPLSTITTKTLLAVAIFVGVGTIIIGGGYLIGDYRKVSKPVKENIVITNNETKEEIIVEEEIKDETADWKTYRNEEYDYTIEHPGDWPVDLRNTDLIIIGNIPYEPSAGPLSIEVYQNRNITFLDEFKNNFPDGCQKEEEISIANLKAWKIICIEAFAGQQKENYFVEKNNNLYHISFIRGSEKLNKILVEIVESFNLSSSEYQYLEVLYPNGSEELIAEKTYDIAWTSIGIDKIDIAITEGGHDRGTIATGIDAKLRKYSWEIRSDFAISASGTTPLFKIGIFDHKSGKLLDKSDNSFAIVIKDDRKTYRNEEYGFEFEYPNDWIIKESNLKFQSCFLSYEPYQCSDEMAGIFNFSLKNKKGEFSTYCGAVPTETENVIAVSISVLENSDNLTTDDIIKKCKNAPYHDCISYVKTIDERKAVDVRIEGIGGQFPAIYIVEGDKIYLISMEYSCDMIDTSGTTKGIIGDIFNQILSTFKFIEKNETANWKTYRNEEHGFEFNYFPEWRIWTNKQGHLISIDNSEILSGDAEMSLEIRETASLENILQAEKNLRCRNMISGDEEKSVCSFCSIEESNIIIAGYNGKKITKINKETKCKERGNCEDLCIDYKVRTVIFQKDNNVYILGTYGGEQPLENFNQILSTFKFIEKR